MIYCYDLLCWHILIQFYRVYCTIYYSHKLFVCEIIINLALNRVDGARQDFSKSMYDDSYLSSSECAAAEDLLRAFETYDEERFEELQTGTN